jgi:hypothetical protein
MGLYVMRDGAGFVEQYGQQLTRKSTELGVIEQASRNGESRTAPVVMVWIAGLVGLAGAADEDRRYVLPVLVQIVLLVVVIPAFEMWYGVYLMPLTYLGIVRGMDGLLARGAARWAVSGRVRGNGDRLCDAQFGEAVRHRAAVFCRR